MEVIIAIGLVGLTQSLVGDSRKDTRYDGPVFLAVFLSNKGLTDTLFLPTLLSASVVTPCLMSLLWLHLGLLDSKI